MGRGGGSGRGNEGTKAAAVLGFGLPSEFERRDTVVLQYVQACR